MGGSKGDLLERILGDRDAIAESDQGRSFRAFYDLLMSTDRQDELTQLLEHMLALDPVKALKPDRRLKRVHFDWLTAAERWSIMRTISASTSFTASLRSSSTSQTMAGRSTSRGNREIAIVLTPAGFGEIARRHTRAADAWIILILSLTAICGSFP